MEGGCSCGRVRYRLTADPLIIHACHCTHCQRETGSAFVINLWMEAHHVETTGNPVVVKLRSESGAGQMVYRCPDCQVAVFSLYDVGDQFRFVRGGTLDDPGAVTPDVHIYTSTKLPWVELGEEIPVFEQYYRRSEVWRPDAYARFTAIRTEQV